MNEFLFISFPFNFCSSFSYKKGIGSSRNTNPELDIMKKGNCVPKSRPDKAQDKPQLVRERYWKKNQVNRNDKSKQINVTHPHENLQDTIDRLQQELNLFSKDFFKVKLGLFYHSIVKYIKINSIQYNSNNTDNVQGGI